MHDEIEAKAVLAEAGIDTTRPVLCTTESEMRDVEDKFEKAMVLKVVSRDIAHKAAVGGVEVNVPRGEGTNAYRRIIENCKERAPSACIDGVLVEEMLSPGPELFIGGRTDARYGPIIMVGRGGGDVESSEPVTALCPISTAMADRLAKSALSELGVGDRADVLQARLSEYLNILGGRDGLLMREPIRDLDINPIIVSEDRLVAVDALLDYYERASGVSGLDVVNIETVAGNRGRESEVLGSLFNPESIAFVGASTNPAKLGNRHIKNIREFGFSGRIYPIHPKAAEIAGERAYSSIRQVPEPPDLVYIAVRADSVPAEVDASVKRGTKVVQVLSAGFSEWQGDSVGGGDNSLEEGISRALHGQSARLVGPNCMGTFSADGGLTLVAARYSRAGKGDISFISQSGTFAADVVRRANVAGIPVGKVVSCGNCLDLKLADYLIYLDRDPQTSLVAFYAESVDDPWLFCRYAKKMEKPVVVFRGGTTGQGIKAAQSHTAALASEDRLWSSAARDAGIIQVGTLVDLLDIFNVFSVHRALSGNRLAIFGSGGGVSVTCSDYATEAGFNLAELSSTTRHNLAEFGVPGTSVANPIDIPVWGLIKNDEHMTGGLASLLAGDPNVDLVIAYVEIGTFLDFHDDERAGLDEMTRLCRSIPARKEGAAPVTLVLRNSGSAQEQEFVREMKGELRSKGICVFESEFHAIRAHGLLLGSSVNYE